MISWQRVLWTLALIFRQVKKFLWVGSPRGQNEYANLLRPTSVFTKFHLDTHL